ncbi:MAG: sulfite exporter TauE/SafE family protein [Rhodospirillales bacterium]|nr:sulfite exporter TauE/SafE family protein [Rhodospirillales bacterium]HJO72127.1 sulfite exporter TauE/SafE family protein [Rhodospirillales bacterium]
MDSLGPEILALLFGALMLGGTVKGVVGIAYPMVAMSLMSSLIEVPTAVILVILPSVASNLLQSGVTRGSCTLVGRFWPVILPLGMGLWWSAGMIAEARPENLFIALGIIIVTFSVLSLYTPNLRIPRHAERWAGTVAGILSGLMGGFSSIFGPPITMYLVALDLEKEVFIRSIGLIFFSGSSMLAIFYWAHGVLHPGNIAWSIAACLPVVLGYGFGQWVRGYANRDLFRKLLLGALILVGLNLLRRGLV